MTLARAILITLLAITGTLGALILLASVGIIGGASTNSGSIGSAPSGAPSASRAAESPSPTKPAPAKTPEARPYAGKTLTLTMWSENGFSTDFAVTVTGVESVAEIGDEKAKGTFRIVYLDIVNNGKSAERFPFGFTGYGLSNSLGGFMGAVNVRDSGDREYTIVRAPTHHVEWNHEELDDTSEPLQPGLTYHFAIVYDVPKNEEHLKLMLGNKVTEKFVYLE